MTASQLFRQTESLKKAVSEASFGSNDGWVSRQKLEDLYQRLLVADLEYALDKKVEQDLWNYVFKNQITLMQQQTKDKHSGKADVQAGLNLFLETASGFYLQETAIPLCVTYLGLPLVLAILAQNARKWREPSAYVRRIMFHPVKSCGGIEIDQATVQLYGLEYQGIVDRSFCLYEDDPPRPQPVILSIKPNHSMSLIKPQIQQNGLFLCYEGMADLRLETNEKFYEGKPRVKVRMNRNLQTLVDCGDEAGDWVSAVLGKAVRVGYSGTFYKDRMTKVFEDEPLYGAQNLTWTRTPVHIVSLSSLNDLRRRVEGVQLSEEQFRQSVLVEGAQAYDEDYWCDIQIGECPMYFMMLAERCTVITNNPQTGEPNLKWEPFTTLKRYRKIHGYDGPPFGIRVGVLIPGRRIRVGDSVHVTRRERVVQTIVPNKPPRGLVGWDDK